MNKKQLQRMLELADVKKPINENKVNPSNIELVKKASNNKVYAIIRENSKYYIKESVKLENLTESDFNYIGGVQNKPKYSYRSFEEASKNLNFMFEDINHNGNSDMVNILESDEELLKEKKFVLKLDKKKSKKSKEDEFDFGDEESGEEGFDFGREDTEEGGEEDFDFGDEEGDTEEGGEEDFDFGDEEGDTEESGEEDFTFGDEDLGDEDLEFDDSEDDIKDIQSTTGKLGQQLRDVEDISSDMQKWVAKSVLSALDLDNMDSDDKKDIIRTIKKKSEEETDDIGGEEEFNFDSDEEIEESYDNYMGDEDDFDGMDSHDWEGVSVSDEFPSRSELDMRDIDMNIQDKGYLNLDNPTVSNPYDSYMKDSFNERSFESFMDEMEEAGMTDSMEYDSYMGDITINKTADNPQTGNLTHAWESKGKTRDEDNPNIGGDEDVEPENLLLDFDVEGDMGSDELDALYGPNSTRRYSRSSYDKARRQADKDISRHYYDPAAPGYGDKPITI
jgi:hypothetical protein